MTLRDKIIFGTIGILVFASLALFLASVKIDRDMSFFVADNFALRAQAAALRDEIAQRRSELEMKRAQYESLLEMQQTLRANIASEQAHYKALLAQAETYKAQLNITGITYKPGTKGAVLYVLHLAAPQSESLPVGDLAFQYSLFDADGKAIDTPDAKGIYYPAKTKDISNFQVWVDNKKITQKAPTYTLIDFAFHGLSFVIPAGQERDIVLRGDISSHATPGLRIGFSSEFATAAQIWKLFTPDDTGPIITIGDTPTPSIHVLESMFSNRTWHTGGTYSVAFTKVNSPADAKLAVILEDVSGQQVLAASNADASYGKVTFTIPSKTCAAADCATFTSGQYAIRLMLYQGNDFCIEHCAASYVRANVIALNRTKFNYQVDVADPAAVDLTVDSIIFTPDPVIEGEAFRFTYVVANHGVGKAAADSGMVNVRNITNKNFNFGGFGGVRLNAGGGTYTAEGGANGTYGLICGPGEGEENIISVSIDTEHSVVESNEDNNAKEVSVRCVSK